MSTTLIENKSPSQADDQQLQTEIKCLQQQLAKAQATIEEQSRVVELARKLLLYAPSMLSKIDDAIMELDCGE